MKRLGLCWLIPLAAVAGCKPGYDTLSMATLVPARVPGTYYCDAIWGSASLVLRPNHTFHESIHTLAPGTGAIPVGPIYHPTAPLHPEVDGTWALVPLSTSRSGTGITLTPFTAIQDFGSKFVSATTIDVEQGRSGVIRLIEQGDSNLYFALNSHNPPPPNQPFEQGMPLHQ